ncbi:MAG: tetratricopeptide repeat protein, partial [Myxococcota bacterium]
LTKLSATALSYPYGFINFLRMFQGYMAKGGVILINDYHAQDDQVARGIKQFRPQLYGDSLNHPVYFSVFEGFARVSGWDCVRTADPLRSLLQAMLAPTPPLAQTVRTAFDHSMVQRQDGTDLLDFQMAARNLSAAGRYRQAARFYQRACPLDPLNSQLHYQLGETCLRAGLYRAAIEALHQCAQREGADALDWEFQMGCAHHQLGRPQDAIDWFERSLLKDPNPTTYANIAGLCAVMGQEAKAISMAQQALRLDPSHARAQSLLEELETTPTSDDNEGPRSTP